MIAPRPKPSPPATWCFVCHATDRPFPCSSAFCGWRATPPDPSDFTPAIPPAYAKEIHA